MLGYTSVDISLERNNKLIKVPLNSCAVFSGQEIRMHHPQGGSLSRARIRVVECPTDAKFAMLEAKIDALKSQQLLTDNLLALNRDIGELKGASHTHTRTEQSSANAAVDPRFVQIGPEPHQIRPKWASCVSDKNPIYVKLPARRWPRR